MIQKTSSLPGVTSEEMNVDGLMAASTDDESDHLASVWVSRITGIGGGICLLIALSYWFARPGHFRPVLILLTVAMFASILHSYVFENGDRE
jgi:hypothetical protein